MFTGLIESQGQIVDRSDSQLRIAVPQPEEPWQLGESVAISGVCLTVVESDPHLVFDISPETWRRTTLGRLQTGQSVNIERAMRAGARLGGHIVQGHVDAVGEVTAREDHADSTIFRVRAPGEFATLLVDKGSVAVDGISLTVVEPAGSEFSLWIIPHTLAVTTLRGTQPGASVNLEFDVIAKYVQRMLAPYQSAASQV